MNLERLFELIFNDPNNISIQYSNVDGEERLIVNGEDLTGQEETYDDSEIKEKIADYKAKIEKLDDYIFEKVLDEAEKQHFNLIEMNKGLELDSYTSQDALFANNVISLMTELIQEVIETEIEKLSSILEDI